MNDYYHSNGLHDDRRANDLSMPFGVTRASIKSRLVCAVLAFFLGFLGIHRFYLGKLETGILWMLTAGIFGFGWLIDFVLVLSGSFKDKYGYQVKDW